jgi:hypothetical protein
VDNRREILQRRIRCLVWVFIAGLVLSGVTEVDYLARITGADIAISHVPAPAWAIWLTKVQSALNETAGHHPFLFYGTDWLAFGHLMIALSFVGALRDPVRNKWLFTFGLTACVLVVPYAFVFGALRGIPFWWRLIDCSFGLFGFVPLWFSRRWANELETLGSPQYIQSVTV